MIHFIRLVRPAYALGGRKFEPALFCAGSVVAAVPCYCPCYYCAPSRVFTVGYLRPQCEARRHGWCCLLACLLLDRLVQPPRATDAQEPTVRCAGTLRSACSYFDRSERATRLRAGCQHKLLPILSSIGTWAFYLH